MLESSIVRILTVLVVMLVVGLIRYGIGYPRLPKAGEDEASGKARAKERKQLVYVSRKYAVVSAFVYMVAMVSVAGFFL